MAQRHPLGVVTAFVTAIAVLFAGGLLVRSETNQDPGQRSGPNSEAGN
jgi:hypothetical protein